ncbi:calcium-independent protein kinase C-like isoform 1-T1 [Anomaloglossus baeobatrachus]|uniref:calcium-independent protein kinase C-like isoform X1 n=1 Tax=Anomaloglossus baeobatrachus TaxID=238106 RepID=UPI003F4F73B8
MDKEKRRAQRDRVLRERRGINEEQVMLFALGRNDVIIPDMDTDALKMASKRQNLEKIGKTRRHELFTKRRKLETPVQTNSADSAELQRAILIALKKLGELVPEIRRRNKDALLNKRRNISAEIELEEDLQERHVTSSYGSEDDTLNLQRAAAQKRIKNNRDWVVQCRRRLINPQHMINGNGAVWRLQSSAKTISIPEYLFQRSDSPQPTINGNGAVWRPQSSAKTISIPEYLFQRSDSPQPMINGNGAVWRPQSSAKTISIPEYLFQRSDSPPDGSLDKDEPADGSLMTPSDVADMPAHDLGDARSRIVPLREMVNSKNPIDLSSLKIQKDLAEGDFGKVILPSDPVSEEPMDVDIPVVCSRRKVVYTDKLLDNDRLTFHTKLGQGGFGKVLLASHVDSEELLAIKIIKKSRCYKDMISTELDVLTMAAGCRYLMPMREFLETPIEYVIAMDYMAGGDLYGYMEYSMMFNTKTIRLFAAEMVCGIQFLHERGIIHRDLKPHNILLQDTGHIKISDFGLAAMNVREDDVLKEFVGTQGYMAPELMDRAGYNHLVDSFSFGVILYMMTVGEEPFWSDATMDDYHYSLQEDIPYFPPGICSNAINIIQRLLCKTPYGRLAIKSSIRAHPFFHSINWSDVESGRAEPPFPYFYDI